MKLKIANGQKMKLLEVQRKVSKKSGNEYEIVTLADIENFERYEFYRNDEFRFGDGVVIGAMVIPTFNMSKNGNYINLDLIDLQKA